MISLALAPEADQAAAFYAAVDCEVPTEWVRDHVLPVLQTEPVTRGEATARLAAYLKGDAEPTVVADWPEDIAHFSMLMITGPGARIPMQTIRFELLDLPLFDSETLSLTPHNALSDASALKAYVTAEERPMDCQRTPPIEAEQVSLKSGRASIPAT